MTEERYRVGVSGGKSLLCQAQIANDKLCNNIAIKGRKYCKHHGGKLPVAQESALFKTGLWSAQRRRFANVAPKLLTRINELREDPELFSLKDDAAYITALMDTRAEAASAGVSLEHYESIRDQYNVCKHALGSDSFDDAFKYLGKQIRDGIDEYKASNDVVELIKKRTEVIEAEQKIMQAKAYTLEVDQAYSLIMQILKVVQTNVKDPQEMSAIKDGFSKLLRVYQEEEIQDAEIIENDQTTQCS
jgi:hypothetical protein